MRMFMIDNSAGKAFKRSEAGDVPKSASRYL